MSDVASVILLIASVALVAILVTLHVLPTGLSPLRTPVSQYAITRYGAGYRAATIAAAVAGSAFAVVMQTASAGVAALITAVLLVVFALSRLLIGFLPMDAPGAAPTRSGRAHTVLAFTTFGSVTAAAFVAGGVFHDVGRPELAAFSTAMGAVMAVGTLAMVVARRVYGFGERVIYVGFIAWFIGVAIAMLIG